MHTASNLLKLLTLSLFCLSLSSPLIAQTFSDDFEAGPAADWKIVKWGAYPWTVSWTVATDGSQVWQAAGGDSSGGGNSVAYVEEFDVADVVVQALVKPVQIRNPGHWSGIVARFNEGLSFYMFKMQGYAQVLYLVRHLSPTESTVLAEALLPQSMVGEWHTLKLEVVGTLLRGYFDDELMLEVEDDTPAALASGSVGFVNAGCVTRFDDFQAGPVVPRRNCVGFDPPMADYPVTVRGKRALPLKAQLFDADGLEITDLDLAAPPVAQVLYDSGDGNAVDVSGDALPVGLGDDGNQFVYTDQWQYNLKTSNYTAPGTYTVFMDSGDDTEYVIDPTCVSEFVIK